MILTQTHYSTAPPLQFWLAFDEDDLRVLGVGTSEDEAKEDLVLKGSMDDPT